MVNDTARKKEMELKALYVMLMLKNITNTMVRIMGVMMVRV